jgi:flagellar assembly protein FliH
LSRNILKSSQIAFDNDSKKYVKIDENGVLKDKQSLEDEERYDKLKDFMEAYSLDLMEFTQQKCDEIIRSAEIEKVGILREAQQMGYEEGLKEGKQEGLKQYQESIQENKKIIEKNRDIQYDLKFKVDRFQKEYETKFIELVLEIAQKVIETEYDEKDEVLMNMIKGAYKLAGSHEDIVIVLSERDFERVEGKIEVMKEKLQVEQFTLKKQVEAEDGTVRIETQSGVIDGSLKTKFERMEAEVRKILSLSDSE